VVGGGVDQTHEPELADVGEPAKLRRVDELPHPRRERHVDLRRDAYDMAASPQGGDFRDFAEGRHRRGGRLQAAGYRK
jgi:hypothetical protein